MRFSPFVIFWGIMFLLIGVNIILKALFNISFPFFRVIVGLFIIYLGVSMITGFSWREKQGSFTAGRYDFLFTTAHCDLSSVNYSSIGDTLEINSVFSDSTIDLAEIDYEKMAGKSVAVRTVFGNTTIFADKDTALELETSTVFGTAVMPGGDSTAFGQMNRSFNSDAPRKLKVKVDVVFGMTRILWK